MREAAAQLVHVLLTTPAVVIVHEVNRWLTDVSPTPLTGENPGNPNTKLYGLAALVTAFTGLIAAAGVIALGWQRKRSERPDDTTARAMRYLIEQNKALLKERKTEKED